MSIKNHIHKLAYIFYMLAFLFCIDNGYFILALIMFVLFVSIIMGSLSLRHKEAKHDCLTDNEKKKIEREKTLRKILR